MSLDNVVTDNMAYATDERLVRECLEGREEAWVALVDKYRNLIFSIPIRHGIRKDQVSVFVDQGHPRIPKLDLFYSHSTWNCPARRQRDFSGSLSDDALEAFWPAGTAVTGCLADSGHIEEVLSV